MMAAVTIKTRALAGVLLALLVCPTLRGAPITVRQGDLHLQVQALRADVLRIRYWRGPVAPEDASWVVRPEARRAVTAVTAVTRAAGQPGFATRLLSVAIDPRDLRVQVRDRGGALLADDAVSAASTGPGFTLERRVAPTTHFFGLGDKADGLDRRGRRFTLWNTDAYKWQADTDPLYKSIPFFMSYDSGLALGTLLDNTWRSTFDFGHTQPGALRIAADGGPLDYYLLYGPSPKQVLAAYAWLTGPTPLPPRWSLGYQQSRYSYKTQARVEEVAARLRSERIPADVMYLDIDYQDRNRPFTVNTQTFPDLAGMARSLHATGFHVVAITDLHIAKAPGQGYAPYDAGLAENRFVHFPDGTVYSGEVWPGAAVFPDFTQAATRRWWGTLYQDFVRAGLDGFWNDMNEPAIFKVESKTMPLDVVHRIEEPGFRTRSVPHAEVHNIYGMQNARATTEGLAALRPNERPFVLTRAAFAGAQRYAATWTGDNSASWDHLRLSTLVLKSLGLSGYSLTGADVGGYAGAVTPALLTKWVEMAAFQPIFREHSESGGPDRELWVDGPEQEAVRRRFVEERYRLLPYLYTTVEDNVRTGLPILRALFLEFPNALPDHRPLDLDPGAANEFLFGPDLLIAPPPSLEQTAPYVARLPGTGWYDYWSGQRLAGRGAAVTPTLAQLPVYVRPGAIIPVAPLTQSTQERPVGTLTLRVYVGADCHGSLYEDDGHTFGYRQGEFLRMRFRCRSTRHGLQLRIGPHEGRFPAWWSQLHVEIHGLNRSCRQARWRGGSSALSAEDGGVGVLVPDTGQGLDLHFE